MARKPRFWVPGQPYHVISQFVDREYRLIDEADREALTRCFELANRRWDWVIIGNAFMSSHFHVLSLAGTLPPGRFFRSANARFARYHHEKYGSLGPVFAARPKQSRVKQIKARHTLAYIHRNPVEAGVVNRAWESTWTSHRPLTRRDPAPSFLDVPLAMEVLGFDDTEAGRRELDDFVMDVALDDRAFYVEDDQFDAIGADMLDRLVTDRLWHWTLNAVKESLGILDPLRDVRARVVVCIMLLELTSASNSEIAARVGLSPTHVGMILNETPSLTVRVACDAVRKRLEQAAE